MSTLSVLKYCLQNRICKTTLQENHKVSRKCIILNSKGNKQKFNPYYFLQYTPWKSLLQVEYLKYLMKHSEWAQRHKPSLQLKQEREEWKYFWVNELSKWKMEQLSREIAPLRKELKYPEQVILKSFIVLSLSEIILSQIFSPKLWWM